MGGTTTVLVVEPNITFATVLRRCLTRAGLDVHIVNRANDVLATLADSKPDVVIIDVHLMDMSGLALCAAVRSRYDVPILVVNADKNPIPDLEPWTAGADGYVADPNRVAEILARTRALMRRAEMPHDPTHDPIRRTGNIYLNSASQSAFIDGKVLDLTRTEYRILEALVEADGRLLSQHTLFELIWRRLPSQQETHLVNTHIGRLRMKLKTAGGASTIVTVRQRGCKLVHDQSSERPLANPTHTPHMSATMTNLLPARLDGETSTNRTHHSPLLGEVDGPLLDNLGLTERKSRQ